MVGAGKEGGMLLAEPSHGESWIWPGARFWWGCGWGSRLKRGDRGVPQDSVSPLLIGKWGQMHFWVLEAVPCL